MKKNFKTWLCSVLVLGTTLAIGLFAAGCSKDDFKNKVDQAFCDHNYGAVETEVKEATCTAEGEKLWTCLDCGKEKIEVIEKIAHDFSSEVGGWTRTKQAATCREEGVQESRCGVCKTIVTESIAKLSHTVVSVEQKLPTCTVAGHTEYTYCSDCNDFITPKVTIPALGHYTKVIDGKAATCDTAGITDGEECKTCGVMVKAQKEIPALGHKIEYLAPVEPTCEMTGLTAGYACVRCDKVYTAQNVVEKLPHVDKDEDGYCDDCFAQLLPDTSTWIETAVVEGETVAGNWYRIYRGGTFSDNTFRLTGVGENAQAERVAFYAVPTSSDEHYFMTTVPGSRLEGMTIIMTDEYIDFFIEEGSYIVSRASVGAILEISADTTIESFNGSVFRLVEPSA